LNRQIVLSGGFLFATLWLSLSLALGSKPTDAPKRPPASRGAADRNREIRHDASDRSLDEVGSAFDEVESTVVRMVNDHLPELKPLLAQLRNKEPEQYKRAIRDLAKSSRRLAAAEKRGPEAFELEVRTIRAQTSVNLLVAKLRVRDRESDRKALRKATETLRHAELERTRHEVKLLQARLERLQKHVQTARQELQEKEQHLDQHIERSLQTFLRKAGRKDSERKSPRRERKSRQTTAANRSNPTTNTSQRP
jgi:hypothetical protein